MYVWCAYVDRYVYRGVVYVCIQACVYLCVVHVCIYIYVYVCVQVCDISVCKRVCVYEQVFVCGKCMQVHVCVCACADMCVLVSGQPQTSSTLGHTAHHSSLPSPRDTCTHMCACIYSSEGDLGVHSSGAFSFF